MTIFAGKIRSAFARAIELDPQNVDARLGLLQFYLVAPGVFGGSLQQAQRQAGANGQVSPLHHALARGMIYQHQNANPEDERAFREAIQDSIPSVAAFACARLESLYRDNGELDKAIALYEDLRHHSQQKTLPFYYRRAFLLDKFACACYAAGISVSGCCWQTRTEQPEGASPVSYRTRQVSTKS